MAALILPCLSVRQAWAWAIVQGLKPWENRPRRFNYRGPVLIHAGKTLDADYAGACDVIERLSGKRPPAVTDTGGLVGAAMLTDCAAPLASHDGWRGAGEFGLRFEHAITLPFRPVKGMLGLFKVELTATEQAVIEPWIATFGKNHP